MQALVLSFALPLSLTIIYFTSTLSYAHNGGFSIDLIHRDSSNSPFYNPLETPYDRIEAAFRRSVNRVNHFRHMLHLSTSTLKSAALEKKLSASFFSDADSPLISDGGGGEYLMNISIGTPPFPILAIADTGSDLIWTQCKPCPNCYKQDAPLFDPKSSSTYRTVSCGSRACNLVKSEGTFCAANDTVCHYQVNYGDNSRTNGEVAVEKLTLWSAMSKYHQVALPKTLIGCGHDNTGQFSPKESGIIGLGGGSASLVNQLGSSISKKFSYCMVPRNVGANVSSTLHFGENAVVSGRGVVSTPLVFDPSNPTFYFLQLEALSVGSKKIVFPEIQLTNGSSGNMIIDSGTSMTVIPEYLFSDLSDAVEGQVTGGTKANDPNGLFSLCYVADSKLKVPMITAHFKGADVVLTPLNTFVPVNGTMTCLAFFGDGALSIYGNVAQQNFLIGYDLQKQTLSFKPTDCTKN